MIAPKDIVPTPEDFVPAPKGIVYVPEDIVPAPKHMDIKNVEAVKEYYYDTFPTYRL